MQVYKLCKYWPNTVLDPCVSFLKPLIFSPKLAASKLTTQTLFFFYSFSDICAAVMHANAININRPLNSVLFINLQKIWLLDLKFACNKHISKTAILYSIEIFLLNTHALHKF